MAQIKTTGNAGIDQATAEIAVALRDACPGRRDQKYYDEAVLLRDAIMKGTRELDGDPFPFTYGSDEAARLMAESDDAVARIEASDDRNLREHTEGI